MASQVQTAATTTPATLTDDERRDLWAAMAVADAQSHRPSAGDRSAAGHAAAGGDKGHRVAFDRADVQVRIVQPGGGITVRSVYAHDLGPTGMSLLHPGYLHVGTAVQVSLPRRLGGEDHADGRVVACRYASRVWHACQVAFTEAVSLKAVVRPGELQATGGTGGPAVRPETVLGDVLVIDGQELDRLLFAHLVRKTKLNVTAVLDVGQAVRSVGDVRFDLIVLDVDPRAGGDGADGAVERLRRAGYAGPIVATGADLAPWVDRLRAAGVEVTIAKPYDEDRLLVALSAALTMGAGPDEDPLYSDLAAQDGIEPLLAAFCRRVQQVLGELRAHVTAGRVIEVRHACVGLRGSAGGFGFPSITAAAAEAVKALDASGDVGEAREAINRMTALCRRASAKRPPAAVPHGR